jgi:Abnormal spindle-like microcephaly-assoc'd, ASPM-SPD-2-Hydin
MRLPQSSSQSLSIRVVSFLALILLALVAMLPLGARAATQQLVGSPAKVRFGAVTVGQSETQVFVLTNTGSTSTTVSAISMGGPEFSVSGLTLPASLAAGESVTVNVTFAPTATGWTGWTEGKVSFTEKAANPSIPLWFAGSGVDSELLTVAPASLSFGSEAVGTSTTLPVVITNGHAHAQTLQAIQTVGSVFSVSGPAMPMSLGPGQSVTLKVTFTPATAGTDSGSVFVTGPALNLPLTGTGTTTTVGQLSIAPARLNFGDVLIGETGTQAAVFTATGGSVTISSASSSSSQFALPGATFPVTIGAGQSVQLNVAFTPQTAGSASASLSFSSNASDAHASEAVAGTGTAPQVSLGWSASTSAVKGYNIYRGTSPGSYTKINTTLDPNTTYTDASVSAGTTYYYAATAVNSSGQESSYSAPVEIAVQ